MYLFYDSEGKFKWACGADSPIDNLVIESGMGALYLDDNDINNLDIIKNYPDYTFQNGIPVYAPISDDIKLPSVKLVKIEEINIVCNQDILNGFYSSVLREPHHYKYDMEAQANFASMANMLSFDNTVLVIKWSVEGLMIEHSREQFVQLFKESNDHKNSKIERYHILKAQILDCSTIEDVEDINW